MITGWLKTDSAASPTRDGRLCSWVAGTSPAMTTQKEQESLEPRRDGAGGRLLFARREVVQRVDVGLGRGGQRVGVGRLAGGDAPVLLEPDRDLRLGVGAFGHRVHLEEPQDRG